MNETLELIQRLSEERNTLYRLAGKSRLLPDQEARLNEITGRLPGLWDSYRRELAASQRPPKPAPITNIDAA
jgi:hypothetical protein